MQLLKVDGSSGKGLKFRGETVNFMMLSPGLYKKQDDCIALAKSAKTLIYAFVRGTPQQATGAAEHLATYMKSISF